MRLFLGLILAIFFTGCSTTQSSATRQAAQVAPSYFSEDGFRLIDLTDIVILNNNEKNNDLHAQVGELKEVDESLQKMLEKETGADKFLSRIFNGSSKDGSATYVVITKVMTNFNLNVVKIEKQGKKTVLSATIYEIVSANQQILEVVKNPQVKPEGYTVINASRKLFPF